MLQFFPLALSLTLLLELPVWIWGLSPRHSWRTKVAACLVANLSSHPVVAMVLPGLISSYPLYVAAAETFAPLWEITLCGLALPLNRRDGLAIVAANLFSWLAGWGLQELWSSR